VIHFSTKGGGYLRCLLSPHSCYKTPIYRVWDRHGIGRSKLALSQIAHPDAIEEGSPMQLKPIDLLRGV
jgi:hypothetical protein